MGKTTLRLMHLYGLKGVLVSESGSAPSKVWFGDLARPRGFPVDKEEPFDDIETDTEGVGLKIGGAAGAAGEGGGGVGISGGGVVWKKVISGKVDLSKDFSS